ncbi:uncharacterized protein KIAA1211 homolog [Gouania willdenowi]|uniref:DUF4592 domain-containing protein n=1 Tax=Gouania willdenowi TaxID=441366 RepID=A0A8C5GGX8_GOUWI|nr:uncharacterized protein KIAA1211-like homolog [Gouania willdenowi]XP_028292626.1 uncharacterized protein KIAA1211-like homolog [Gouania willdenowi]XP_028292627.1 uncharacterized protein KIAA1211-like homolog [Gouania willdenowi]
MENLPGDTDEAPEDSTGRKKSKLKSLKTRIFGRSKRTGEEEKTKLSQSASDITAAKRLGSEEDLECSQVMMGSRAMSHDSIFLADQATIDAEPARVLSQENVHSKIKALQMKLQQQKMHLGPPPMVFPKRSEDTSPHLEDNLPRSPPDTPEEDSTLQDACFKMPSHDRPLSPIPKSAPIKSAPLSSALVLPQSVPTNTSSSTSELPLDFSTPAKFTPCLDTSAARHRMHIKPKKQRASTKKTITANQSQPITDQFQLVKEEEQMLSVQEEVEVETEQRKDDIYCSPLNSAAVTTQSSSTGYDHVLPGASSGAHQIVCPTLNNRTDPLPNEQLHTFMESEFREKSERVLETQAVNQDKGSNPFKSELAEVSSNQLPTSSAKHLLDHQQAQVEAESIQKLKRPAPGSGSFHFTINTAKNQAAERPRSGSFVEVLEQAQARQKRLKEAEERKEDLKGLQGKGGSFTVGRLRQEGTRVTPWDRRDSLKKVEHSQGAMVMSGDAKKVQEEEGKAAFGIKLRSTSQSVRVLSDSLTGPQSKSEEDQGASKSVVNMADKLPANISTFSKELRVTDPADLPHPVRQNAPVTEDPHATPTTVPMTFLTSKEAASTLKSQDPPPAPQTTEVSWMSLAIEKTRSLQQLVTRRFPREFTGTQTAGRTQAQVQSTGQTDEALTVEGVKPQQSVLNQQSADTVKAEKPPSTSQMQTVKSFPVKISTASPVLSNTPGEAKTIKPTTEEQSQASTAQSISQPASHPPVQTNPRTNLPPQRTLVQAETAVHSTQPQSFLNQQQPAWRFNSLKLTASGPTSSLVSQAVVPSSVTALEKGERDASGPNEAPPISIRKAVWSGSVNERAAFLERHAEWTSSSGPSGVEMKKTQPEVQTSTESAAFAKIAPPIRDTAAEGRQGRKPEESVPTKILERPREDKWMRKSTEKSSSPSSSPLLSSVLAVSESSQPSWMEMAKRKSMAWSDKTMD